jgi:hypothetical protein
VDHRHKCGDLRQEVEVDIPTQICRGRILGTLKAVGGSRDFLLIEDTQIRDHVRVSKAHEDPLSSARITPMQCLQPSKHSVPIPSGR